MLKCGVPQGSILQTVLFIILAPWNRVLIENLTGSQLVKKFPAFYGTWRFITAFTTLPYSEPYQSNPYPHPIFWRAILILSSHLCLGLASGFFPSCFPTKTLYAPLLSSIHATCPAHLILLDFITRTILGEEYRLLSSPLCNFLCSSVTLSLLHQNTFHSTLFSDTLSLRSSLNVCDQVSHPYKTTEKIIICIS